MTGQEIYNLIVSILGGERPDPVYLLQLINLSRIQYEIMKPWKVLSINDHSQTVSGGNNYTVAFDLPPDFVRLLGESTLSQGSIILFDGNDNVQYLTQIPIENILFNKNDFGYVAIDYGLNKMYLTGVIPGTFNIYIYYIMDTAPITLTTTWQRFPKRYHPILAFDAATRFRLGTDYDDVNARNADDNAVLAKGILNAMFAWDDELAISSVNSLDYANRNSVNNNNIRGPRGIRANN